MKASWGVVFLSLVMVTAELSGLVVRAEEATPAAGVSIAEQREVEIPDTRIISLSPDGTMLVAAKPAMDYDHGQLCTYEVATLAERACADLSVLDAGLRIEDVVWSPDSSKVAFSEQTLVYFKDGDIWIMDAATGALTNFTDEGVRGPVPILSSKNADVAEILLDVNPAWSPDGQSLAFSRSVWRDGDFHGNEIAIQPLGGDSAKTIVQVNTDSPGIVYFGIHWQVDGSRLFYNVGNLNADNPDNGIWVVDAGGQNAHQVAGTTDPDLSYPVAVQVSPDGKTILGYYVIAANTNATRGPFYALIDVASGQAKPLTVLDPNAPEQAFVSLATLSPDGSKVLYVSRLTDPEYQVFVRDVAGDEETRLSDGLPRAFTIGNAMIPTWATDGSVFMNSDLGKGTLLRLEGGAVATPVAAATEVPGTPAAGTPEAGETGLTLTEQRAIEIPDSRIISLSPDGKWIAAAKPAADYRRGQLCIYDVVTLAERSCGDLSGLEAGLRIEDVTWSPDGSHLAFSEEGFKLLRDGDLWLMDAATGALTNIDDDGYSGNVMRLITSEQTDQSVSMPVNPAFSPDGRTIAFSRSIVQSGAWTGNDIAVVSIDGGEARRVVQVTPDVPGVVYFGIRWAPDASRLFYSVHYPDKDEPDNGIWVVDVDGGNQRQIIGTSDPEAGAPAVSQVSADGSTLLVYYPILASAFATGAEPVFALVNAETGTAERILVPDPNAPEHAWVGLAALSPDGMWVLTLDRLTDPDRQIWVTGIDGSDAAQLGDALDEAGWIALGLLPTWASDGSVLIPGGGSFSTATLMRIAGSEAPPLTATSVPTTPVAGTPEPIEATGPIAPGTTVTVNDDSVRMRAAPSRDAVVVLELDRGTELIVTGPSVEGDGFVWWPVEEPETHTIGWVRAEFLTPGGP